MIEEVLATARYNPKVDPALGIWTWEIAFYLFLGGMAAGIMLFAAWAALGRKKRCCLSRTIVSRCGHRSCCRWA